MTHWQDEILKVHRRREWRAFYLGALVATFFILFGALALIQATGGPGCGR